MKKTQWMLYTKRADFDQLAARFSISPVLVRIMINRGVAPDEIGTYLHGTLADLPDPGRMKDLDRAADKMLLDGISMNVIIDFCQFSIQIPAKRKPPIFIGFQPLIVFDNI